ncbi:MAG: nuclease-related domain-containing protein [Alphaproteobacteria bacterium]
MRNGGEFADRQIRFHGKKMLWGLGGCVAFCAVFFFVSHGLAGVIGMVAVFELFRANYDEWEHWYLGMRGELAVTKELKSLPDDYVLLNDLFLPNGRGNIDHFLLGPNGLFVIETKNYSGNVKCDGDRWFINGHGIKSLSWQAKCNALDVRKSLEAVFFEQRTKLPFVEPVLAFVKHKERLDLHEPTTHVVKAEDLARFVLDYPSIRNEHGNPPRTRRRVSLSPELIRAIVHHIHSLQNRRPKAERNVEHFVAADVSGAESRWSF